MPEARFGYLGEPPAARLSRRLVVGWLMTAVGFAQAGCVVLLLALALRPAVGEPPKLLARVFYDAAPAAPPPLPRGSPRGSEAVRPEAPRPAIQEPRQADDALALPAPPIEELEQAVGSETGSERGDPSGMEGGIDDGMIGGQPGGIANGVPNATGTEPVLDYDAPPRIVRQPRPRYPTEAFVQKVQGTVVLEIVIDASGRVSDARIVQSIPLLDQAAREAVNEWLFVPAMRRGRPVRAIARAPVRFNLY
jgi:protein TonB